MLPLRVKFMGEGHVAHFPMESAGTGAMLPSVQISSRGHVAEELLLRMFVTLGHVALEGEVYGGRPCCPFPNGKCKSWCHVAQCLKKLQGPCCRGVSTSDVPAVTLGHVALEGEVYGGRAMLPTAEWKV